MDAGNCKTLAGSEAELHRLNISGPNIELYLFIDVYKALWPIVQKNITIMNAHFKV